MFPLLFSVLPVRIETFVKVRFAVASIPLMPAISNVQVPCITPEPKIVPVEEVILIFPPDPVHVPSSSRLPVRVSVFVLSLNVPPLLSMVNFVIVVLTFKVTVIPELISAASLRPGTPAPPQVRGLFQSPVSVAIKRGALVLIVKI